MGDQPETVASAPKLWLTMMSGDSRGETIEVSRDGFVIGRDQKCDLVIDDPKVSREHARISLRGPRPVLYDLQSANGTFLNGQRVRPAAGFTTSSPPVAAELRGGEILQLGDTIISTSPIDPAQTS